MEQRLKNLFVPSLFTAGASVGVYKFLIDEDISTKINFVGQEIPIWGVVFATSLIGNMAGELINDMVGPKLKNYQLLAGAEDIIVPPLLTGASTFGVMKFLVSNQTDFKNAMIVGAGGSFIGNYVYKMI